MLFRSALAAVNLVLALISPRIRPEAEQWTEAMERWCETNAIGSPHGRCRIHRAEILRLRGSCNEAESQVLIACEELRPYLRRELGWPLSELGRIRQIQWRRRQLAQLAARRWCCAPRVTERRRARAFGAARVILSAEERANSLPVKMMIPLGLCIFPVVMMVIMLPVIIRMRGIFF